jgi:hypothetical protein
MMLKLPILKKNSREAAKMKEDGAIRDLTLFARSFISYLMMEGGK